MVKILRKSLVVITILLLSGCSSSNVVGLEEKSLEFLGDFFDISGYGFDCEIESVGTNISSQAVQKWKRHLSKNDIYADGFEVLYIDYGEVLFELSCQYQEFEIIHSTFDEVFNHTDEGTVQPFQVILGYNKECTGGSHTLCGGQYIVFNGQILFDNEHKVAGMGIQRFSSVLP